MGQFVGNAIKLSMQLEKLYLWLLQLHPEVHVYTCIMPVRLCLSGALIQCTYMYHHPKYAKKQMHANIYYVG